MTTCTPLGPRHSLALVMSLWVSTACGPGAGPTRWDMEFEYMRRGGACATDAGPATCELRVVVRDDGTWRASGIPTPADTAGTLPLGAASTLATVFAQSVRYFTEVPFVGVCPTATGGEEYGYVERRIPYGPGSEGLEPRVREIRSCVYDLERYDSLVKRNQIEVAWLALKPPELDQVEFR